MGDEVRFSSSGASIAGTIGGVALATGVPWVLLNYGGALAPTVLTVLVCFGVGIGGLMALASAFFGVVMPTHVQGHGHAHGGHHPHHRHGAADELPARTPGAGEP